MKNEGKGEGGGEGGGWGGDRQRNRQVNAQVFVKTTLEQLPCSFSPKSVSKSAQSLLWPQSGLMG